jgi:Ca2+-binding EF-hand superfamily protein
MRLPKAHIFDNYEARIREMSTPEKTFNYFASVLDASTGERFMTLEDFLKCLSPSWRSGSGRVDPARFPSLSLADIDGDGRISFTEFVVFSTLLAVPSRDFELAFGMFDLDGDGTLDRGEFLRILSVLKSHSPVATHQRSVVEADSGILAHFFGRDGRKRMPFKTFEKFLSDLHREVLRAEFEHAAGPGKATLSPRQFAETVLSHTRSRYAYDLLAKARQLPSQGEITWADYLAFHGLLDNLDELQNAMKIYLSAQELDRGFTKAEFKRAAGLVSKRAGTISDLVVDTVFAVFDKDGDNRLSSEEFITVMKYTASHGMRKPRDIGFTRGLQCAMDCFKAL